MNWENYEIIRDDVLNLLKQGRPIHQLNQIARIYCELFEKPLIIPTCLTTYIEWVLQIEREYKNYKIK